MAASISQYTPIFLPGEHLLLQRSLEGWFTVYQRIGQDQSYPKHINTRLIFFLFLVCSRSTPVRVESEGGEAAWLVGTLVAPGVQGHRLPPKQELWHYQSLFLSLFSQSFSIALPIQALREIPCLGSFSVV